MNYKPYHKVGDEWTPQDGFYKNNGWIYAKEIYKKISGTWNMIYSSAAPKPTGTVSSTTTDTGQLFFTVKNVANAVKVVVHTGRALYTSTPTLVTDGYRSGEDEFRVFNNPGGRIDGVYTRLLVAGINYYTRAWAQDSAGVWHLLGGCRVNAGTPIKVVTGAVKQSPLKFSATQTGLWGPDTAGKTGQYITSWSKTASTIKFNRRFRVIGFYGQQIANHLNNDQYAITKMTVQFNRYPDDTHRMNYEHWLEYHKTGVSNANPNPQNLDGYLWLDYYIHTMNTKFPLPVGTTVITIPESTYDEWKRGVIKSISMRVASAQDSEYEMLYNMGSFLLTIDYEKRVYGQRWPINTSVAV